MNSPRAFNLALLGGAAILDEDGVALTGRIAQRHRIALLALLTLAPGCRLSRDKLIALLWPETSTDRGRGLLNASVYAIRSALGEETLQSKGDDLLLESGRVWSDVAEFEAALERGDLDEAVRLYRGPLLDGFYLSGAPEFDRTIERHRERLRHERGRAVEKLAEREVTRGDHAQAAAWWRVLAAEDPYNARVVLSLMTALAASGDRAGAIRQAQLHAELLRSEVGVEPDAGVVALAKRLKAGPGDETTPAAVDSDASDTVAPADKVAEPALGEPAGHSARPAHERRSRRRSRLGLALVALVAIAVLAAAQRLWFAEPEPSTASVAVLPFVNIGDDPQDEYFSDGMTEELIHALAGVDGLSVTARTSAFQFKGQTIDVREVGRRLGVGTLVEGSVRRGGGRLRVTAQLVSARDGAHLWSQVYDREIEDAVVVQEEIARSIARALRRQLAPDVPLVATHSTDIESYRLYLKARYAMTRGTPQSAKLAIDYFNQAIARDSNYALAWSGLASAHSRLYDVAGFPPAQVVPGMRQAAERALALDSTLAEPYETLGWIATNSWEWKGAEAALKRAIALDPRNPTVYLDYSTFLDNTGRFEEALEVCLLARELDPLSQHVAYNVAGSYLHLARFAPAVAEARAMIALNPTLPLGYDALGWALVDSGVPAEAIEPLETAVRMGEGRWLALANLGRAYALTGRDADARDVLVRLERSWGGTGLGNFAMASVHLALGERDAALQELREVYKLHFAKVPHERQWTAFEPLYNDPEFLRIVREAGFQIPCDGDSAGRTAGAPTLNCRP